MKLQITFIERIIFIYRRKNWNGVVADELQEKSHPYSHHIFEKDFSLKEFSLKISYPKFYSDNP